MQPTTEYPRAPRIIGITGFKRAGKDSLAAALRPFGYKQIIFAGGLKVMIEALLKNRGFSHDTIERMISGDMKEQPVAGLYAPSFAEAYKMLNALVEFQGGKIISTLDGSHMKYFGGFTPSAAADSLVYTWGPLLEKNGGCTCRWAMQTLGTEWGRVTISDTIWVDATMNAINAEPDRRFVISDVRFLNEAELIVRVGGTVLRVTRPGTGSTDPHPSEVEMTKIVADYTIENDTTREDFAVRATAFYNEVLSQSGANRQ